MMVSVTFLPNNITISVEAGTTVLEAMIRAGLHPDAPCGGRGTCGKCKVQIDRNTVLACQIQVHSDLMVRLSEQTEVSILESGVTGTMQADGVHEYVAAFDDLNPQAPVHTLIVPKKHIENIKAIQKEDFIYVAEIHKAIQEVAKIKGVEETGYRIISNCGKDAGQTVMHLHYHLLAGEKMGDKIV